MIAVVKEPCTCAKGKLICSACRTWNARARKEAPKRNRRKPESGVIIRDRRNGAQHYTQFSVAMIERVQEFDRKGVPHDFIAQTCGLSRGSINYIIRMEILEGAKQ